MKETKKTNPQLRLTLPAAAVQRLRKSGIYCTPSITVEFQQATKRHVLRGRESGGAIKEFGHYVSFCGEGGERLAWFVRPDSLTSNGDHAIVLAPALVSVEALRVEHTYELLIARHELQAAREGARPRIWSQVVFRGWQGQLPLDLVEKDRSVAGKIAPEFFTRAGEARQLPVQFVEAVHAVTNAVNCRFCSHPHFLVEPRRGTSPIVLPNGKDSLAMNESASGDISGRTSMSDGAQGIECEAQTETTKGEQPMAVTIG
jgi:hypothetical protein